MDNSFVDWFIDLQGDELTIYKYTDVWDLMEKYSLVFRERGDLESISFDLNIKGIKKDISQVILNSRKNKAKTQEEVEFIHFYNLVEGHELEFVISLAKENKINFSKLPKILQFYDYEVFKHYFLFLKNPSYLNNNLFSNCLYFLSLLQESQNYIDYIKLLIAERKSEILKVIIQLQIVQENNQNEIDIFKIKRKYYYFQEKISKEEDEKRDHENLIYNYYQVKKFLENYQKGEIQEKQKDEDNSFDFEKIFKDVTDYKYFWVLFDLFQIEKNFEQYKCNKQLIEATYDCRIDFSDKLLECWKNTEEYASTTSKYEKVIRLLAKIIRCDPNPVKCFDYYLKNCHGDSQELLYSELPQEIVVLILKEKKYELYIEDQRRGCEYLEIYSKNVLGNLTKDNYRRFAKKINLSCFLVMRDYCKNYQASIDLCKQYLDNKILDSEDSEDSKDFNDLEDSKDFNDSEDSKDFNDSEDSEDLNKKKLDSDKEIKNFIHRGLSLYQAYLRINDKNQNSEDDEDDSDSDFNSDFNSDFDSNNDVIQAEDEQKQEEVRD